MSTSTNSILKNALDRLEDTLTSPVLRQNSYQDLQNALNAVEAVDEETAKRLFTICIRDLNKDIKYATNASTIIGILLVKIRNGQCSTTSSLVASAVCMIRLLKTIASATKYVALKGILFNTLLSYPDDTLISIATESTDKVIELLNAYIAAGNKVVPITFLTTLLKILPNENKITFVKEALVLCFLRIIPLIMGCLQTEQHVTSCVELFESLTEVLVYIDYAENPHWKVLIECIYNPKKYPAIMKSMLENRSDVWHRLWIVFIKLLKDQVTKVSNSSGSPINSILPVVEAAFKMDPVNRCRAFQCWTVLIDNFSRESNEAYIKKRLNLLLIPLKSNNAKVEETAISKFNTWWHLVCRFHNKMEGLTDIILMPFFHFCFGKRAAKSPVAPGQFSDTLKKLSLQALVEIFGHVDCESCVNIPKLKSRLLSTKILVDYWKEWLFGYKVAVTTVLESNSDQMIQQIACIWKSLVMTIGELPENNIRKDLFMELLQLILLYLQDCQHNIKLADLVMNIMIKTLFQDDNKIISLLVTKGSGPMYMILPMLSNSVAEEFYTGKTVEELLLFFKPITTFMMNNVLCCPNRITIWLLKSLPANDYTLVLWMALVEAVCESKHDLAEATLASILSYPIQNLNAYSYEKSTIASHKWFATYSILGPKLGNVNFEKECIKIILEQTELDCLSKNIFILHVSLAVAKQKLIQTINDDCVNVMKILLNSMSSIDTYSNIDKIFPALIDTLIIMGSKLKDNINVPLARIFVSALKLTLKWLLIEIINDITIIFVEKILLSLVDVLNVKEYRDLTLIIEDELFACSLIDKKHASKIKSFLSMLTLHLPNYNKKQSLEHNKQKVDTVSVIVAGNDETIKTVTDNNNSAKEVFNAPNVNYCKTSNKRAASIVNTVVENGEEYEVVKSNWKFNPRKLTENQKEKLTRKREDIPALYQDLSQSQDEFKLRAWRPESQETTTTSSKSASISNNEDAITVLNQIASTDVVPKIFEYIRADSARANVDNKSSGDDVIVNNTQKQITTKDVKSPRMALKDRVFRNVRNLVEKSSLSQDVIPSLLTKDVNKTSNENTSKTPTNKVKISTNVVNSAPPKISSERPSRVIKKPKKFDDSEIISLRKKRQLQDVRTNASEIIGNKRRHSEDAHSNAFTINNLNESPKLHDLPVDELEKTSLMILRESKDSQLNAPEINSKNMQQSRNSQSHEPNMDLKRKKQSGVDAIINLKKRRQSQDSQFVDPVIITLKDSQVQRSRSDGSDIIDSITKQQTKVSQADTSKINNLKNRQQSQDSQSVIPEINILTNSEQLQELRPDSPKIDSLNKRRQSQDSPVIDSEIISLSDSQQVQELRSDSDQRTDLITKPQLQASRADTPKSSNLKERRQSQESQSVISEIITLTNSEKLQESRPDEVKEKNTVVLMERDKDLGDTTKHAFKFTSDNKQNTQNLDILADSQSREQYINTVPSLDISLDLQPKEKAMSLDSQLKEQPTNISPIQNILPESQPNEQSISNKPLQDILSDSQTKEQSSVLFEENQFKQIIDDNNDKKEKPTLKTNKKDNEEKSGKKKGSRIVKQLLIDMVESNPILQAKPHSSSPIRATRKSSAQKAIKNNTRQALWEKLEKLQSDPTRTTLLTKTATKTTKKTKKKTGLSPVTTLSESQERQHDERASLSLDDQPFSEDVIESSQDSTITTMSVKSSKSILKKQPAVLLDEANAQETLVISKTSKEEFDKETVSPCDSLLSHEENNEDSQFPKNVTLEKAPELDLTENMDTQPVRDRESCGDVIFITNEQEPIVINTENTFRELNTQETAAADTEPMNVSVETSDTRDSKIISESNILPTKNSKDDTTKTISETFVNLDTVEHNYSPSKDEPERNQDFLNNTREISPIKTLSPLHEKRSPSPETSNDYVVINLTSPVHSNGEPYEKCDSPEVFTEDKISPDKRNESPPRVEVIVNNTSPSSLSLKKNRPQRRAGGRAAQMLDLCANMKVDDSADSTDNRKSTAVNTPAKRNLKSLYNLSVANNARENTDIESDSAEREQFLEFKKSLPTASSSPAGPILKRKFTEINDETTLSPANKRKRVSFHDPPVSTTVAVLKYIEPGAIRSPQHSTIKRRDRPIRSNTVMKSPKRLETVFNLENVLSKAVESFGHDDVVASMEDTEISSIEQTPTPALEVVKSSDLNDTDPVCPALLNCNDPIENIAAELSSPAMKSLFIKEIEGKVSTIADLANMTELEINRLCIKAPKVQVARKVLLEYALTKRNITYQNQTLHNQDNLTNKIVPEEAEIVHIDAEIQTSGPESSDDGTQTDATPIAFIQTQTDSMPVAHTSAQTDESDHISNKDVIPSCLSERPDFIAQLSKHLEVTSVADDALLLNSVLELLSKKMTSNSNSVEVKNEVVEVQSNSNLPCESTQDKLLSFLENHLYSHFDSKKLNLFGIQLLKRIYENST